MICPSCGYSEESQFCKHCGAPMVSEKKANFLGTPQFTGVTIPPPTATEGFKAADIDTLGSEEEGMEGMEEGMGESMGNSFGLMLVVVIVGAIILFALKMGSNLL